ncbi:DNA polymerase I [Thermoleophilia bacterium SCSIO 60948]|nr:DNA polymerase I [Thermoleophilia bacterium SCSIO 60948]
MPEPERELFLIDGNSLAYRAFFALPESIATADGRPTNAIFGFASMMAKILVDHQPSTVICAWDAGLSGRDTTYKEYKGHRPGRPDLLKEQWPHLAPMAEAFGFTNVKVDGYEADDVIATLTRQASEAGHKVMIVSGDRDVYQLVGDRVRVMTTSRGVTDTKTYDTKGVVERYGVRPDQVPDLIGLRGDTSDNIPGVPGIGDKTAAQLLQKYETVEGVLDSIDEISGAKRKQNLTEHADDARVSKQLATMVFDVEVPDGLLGELRSEPDLSRLRDVAAEFELRSVIRRLEEEYSGAVPERSVDETLEVEAEEGKPTELADGPVSIALAGGRFAAADAERIVTGDASDLGALAGELRDRPVIAHDVKDLGGTGRRGLIQAAGPGNLDLHHDTMVAAYLIDPARRDYGLAELAADAGLAASSSAGEGASEAPADAQLSLDAAAEAVEQADPSADARLVFELARRQREQIDQFGLMRLLTDIEMPLIEVLADLERAGIKLDAERLAEIGAGMEQTIDRLQTEIWELAGEEFTIGSPQKLGVILFEKLGLTRKRRGKTGYSTDARVLGQIRDEHEIVPRIEQWRELTKLKNTYLDSLPGLIDPETGRIHTTFNQVAAATGRLSSQNPNLQNIPIRSEVGRPVRGCFVAGPGNLLLSADYDQVELRVLAHVADETVLREIFASGEDVHTATAAEMLAQDGREIGPAERSKAKMINYGIAYGLSAFGLADRLAIPREEAAAYIDRYFQRFPAIQRFIDRTIDEATEAGYVTTLLGRRRLIPELRSTNRQRKLLGERLAVNTVIQGTAADIIKIAMINATRALTEAGLETRLILQIHDELLFEGPESEIDQAKEIAVREMVEAFPLDPPLSVEPGVGPDWLAAK